LPEGHSVVERDIPPGEGWESWFRPEGKTHVALDVDRRGDQLTIRGGVEARGEFPCSRCAVPVTRELVAPILVVAVGSGRAGEEDQATLEQEGSILYHDGLELDLGESIREAIILEIPQVVLCRPDCRGLCPVCGADLNEGGCSCTPERGDPRWEALKHLKDSPRG
jgi:uncharacterized protein